VRKCFVDNLRWLCVLLLIPYHTAMIYNGFGENFYVKGASVPVLNDFILICSPWFMPLLFAVAGISTAYALERRTPGQYVKERLSKLFIPFVSGLLLIVPVQTYFAERFHNGYAGGYFEQYVLFFTKPTDLSGYAGGFTPGHLWFILYLFVISMIALAVILFVKKLGRRLPVDKMTLPMILPLFIFTALMSFVLNIGGKSLEYYFAYFMLGYYILPNENIQTRLVKARWILLGAFAALTILKLYLYNVLHVFGGIWYGLLSDCVAWLGILTFMGLGRRYLEKSNKLTRYFTQASFPFYILHQSILVAVAFYVFQLTSSVPLQVILIIIGTIIMTVAAYEALSRIPGLRFLFGIKKARPPAQ
jgi:surface polysaccharide O-acyltransferase-like enzyme